MKEENKKTSLKDDNIEIDVIKLINELWTARKTIVKITIAFGFLGFFIAIFSKNEFTASTTFVPVNQGESIKSNLGGLASFAGINLGAGNGSAEIPPELYPQIVGSIPFQLELLNTYLTIDGQEQQVTYREFYENIYQPGLLANIKKYTLGLPAIVSSLFKSNVKPSKSSKDNSQLINVSIEDYDLIKQLKEQVNLTVNDKQGFVTIGVVFPEAIASAQLTLKAQKLLQEYALNFKTQKSIYQLNYLKARFAEKQKEFNSVKIKWASFQDQNSSINTALGKTKLLQLQSDYELVFEVYSELAKQVGAQELQVKKDTPLFTVLKPVTIPKVKSAPKRFVILAGFLFLGVVLSFLYVFAKRYLANLKKELFLKSNEI